MAAPKTFSSIAARPDVPPASQAWSDRALLEETTLQGESAPVPNPDPWDCLGAADAGRSGLPVFLWEAPHGERWAGIGAAASLEVSGAGRFEDVRSRFGALLGRARHREPPPSGYPGAIAIGGFSFAEQGSERGWPGFGDAAFTIPARLFWRASGVTYETRWSVEGPGRFEGDPWTHGEAERPDLESLEPPEPERAWSEAEWIRAVRETLGRIRDGQFSKAVLARWVEAPLERDRGPLDLMASLRAAYPGCYRFLVDDGRGRTFLGASPERLVRLAGGEVLTEAVAGTQRCAPGENEEGLARALAGSEKDRAEHSVVLRHLVETLTPVCDTVAPGYPEVLRLPHLLHLRTPVRGVAKEGAHVLDLLARLHPTPAVAGWPRDEALAWIDGVEGSRRGWYAGPVGWMNGKGEGDFAVGIRSVAVRAGRARVFAGAGIVEGSDPALEWDETELKMKGTLDALANDR